MSITSIKPIIDKTIQDLCSKFASHFSLNEKDLLKLWNDRYNDQVEKIINDFASNISDSKEESKDPDLEVTKEKILTSTKDGLTAMCKKLGVKTTGKKDELIARLLEKLSSKSSSSSSSTTSSKASSSKSKADPPVIQRVKDSAGIFEVRMNKWGNYEHLETGLVFENKSDRLAVGKQSDDGHVLELTMNEIELCKKFNIQYKIPKNLGSSREHLENLKLDDEDEEEEEEEEEEEVEMDDEIPEEEDD